VRVLQCEKKVDVDALLGVKLDESHYDVLLGGDEACDVYKPDGTPLVKYRPGWFSEDLCREVAPVCRRAAAPNNNRGAAAGYLETVTDIGTHRPIAARSKTRYQTLKRDGTMSNTVRAGQVNSGIIGYFDRSARFPFCRQTSFLIKHASLWGKFMPFIVRADEGFHEFMPERWAVQKEYCERTAADWVIPQSTFTTVTVNRNFQTATHKDAGDLHEGFGVMACLRNSKYEGGHIVFPAYRVAVAYSNGCLCLADVHEWHGNTPLSKLRVGYERITLVFYYREKMLSCLPVEEEVRWAKNRKRGEKLS
jgi:hypothetical protein